MMDEAKAGRKSGGGFAPEERSAAKGSTSAQRRPHLSGIPKARPQRTRHPESGALNLPVQFQGPRVSRGELTAIGRAILGSRSGASKRLKPAASDGGLLPLFLAQRT